MKEVNGILYGGFFEEAIEQLHPAELLYISYSHEITEQIYSAMKHKNITKAELAERMGVSRSLVTKFLSGEHNLSLRSFTKMLASLEVKPVTKLVDSDQGESCWVLLPRKSICAWSRSSDYNKEVDTQKAGFSGKEPLAA